MRIAFYAPLKPPDHPVASGDRAMARALIAALERAGHDVELASRFRSRDGAGDDVRQERLQALGWSLAERYLRRVERGAARPDLWFTYHLYHKAPDWLGPPVSERLRIPYVIAEASHAPKQAGGRWELGYRASLDAIRRADLILEPNPVDAEEVQRIMDDPRRVVPLLPFLDTAPFRAPDRTESRSGFAAMPGLDSDVPWLLTVAMMRDDQKRHSYECLAKALGLLSDRPWHLIIAGEGPAEADLRRTFAPFGERVRWIGVVAPDTLRTLYRAADLYLWPAIKEAWGMALLEAQAAGLPVVAGRSGGVASIVTDGMTGLLTPEGDAAAFAAAVDALLADPHRRKAMGDAALRQTESRHDIRTAADFLDRTLRKLVGGA